MKKSFVDYLQMKPRLTEADLAVAEFPAIGAWLGAWLAAERIGVQYRAIGITPEGLGATLFTTPALLLAWPVAVALAWAVLRGDARHRGKLKAFAYGGSALVLGGCCALWYAPLVGSAVDALK
jgi:hypothetical protein